MRKRHHRTQLVNGVILVITVSTEFIGDDDNDAADITACWITFEFVFAAPFAAATTIVTTFIVIIEITILVVITMAICIVAVVVAVVTIFIIAIEHVVGVAVVVVTLSIVIAFVFVVVTTIDISIVVIAISVGVKETNCAVDIFASNCLCDTQTNGADLLSCWMVCGVLHLSCRLFLLFWKKCDTINREAH